MSKYNIIAYTHMGDFGQILDKVRIEGAGLPEELSLSDFVCERCNTDCGDRIPGKGVIGFEKEDGALVLELDPCLFRGTFCITLKKDGQEIVARARLRHADGIRPRQQPHQRRKDRRQNIWNQPFHRLLRLKRKRATSNRTAE